MRPALPPGRPAARSTYGLGDLGELHPPMRVQLSPLGADAGPEWGLNGGLGPHPTNMTAWRPKLAQSRGSTDR
jgi:hypothetical protein